MTQSALQINSETETSISAEQLTAWFKDLDKHGDALLDAIRQGKAKVTTATGFSEISVRLREYARAYADEALKVSELTTQKAVLANTIFYLLKSCERIAGNADKIGELIAVLPLGEGLDAKSILGILMDGKKRDTIFQNGKLLAAAFEASWLSKIDVNALGPILSETGMDFSAYAQLVDMLKNSLPQETKTALPHG